MGNNYLGAFKNKKVYKVSKSEMKITDEVILVDHQNGEMVFNGEVIGKLNLKTMQVDNIAVPYTYAKFLKSDMEELVSEVKLPVEELKIEEVLDSAMNSSVICGIDLDAVIREGVSVG